MKRLRVFIIPVAVAFAAGVLMRDVAQDRRDQERVDRLAAQVRACPQYVVVSKDGKTECRALMPRFEIFLPSKPLRREPM